MSWLELNILSLGLTSYSREVIFPQSISETSLILKKYQCVWSEMCILLPSTQGGREAQLLLWRLTVVLHLALHGSCSSSELLSGLGSTHSCVDYDGSEKMKGRSDPRLSAVRQQQCGLPVSCHPNHHFRYRAVVEADFVAVTLACKSWHPAPDLKSLQPKWKIKTQTNPNWKRFGKTGEVM